MSPSAESIYFIAVDPWLLLVARRGREVRVVQRIQIPALAQVANDGAGGAAVVTRVIYNHDLEPEDQPAPPVRRFRGSLESGITEIAPVNLQNGVETVCALFHGPWLFLGGQRMWVDEARKAAGVHPVEYLASEPAVFAHRVDSGVTTRLELPPTAGGEAARTFKMVDALVVESSELLAFDNLLIPIWLFVYALDGDEIPTPRCAYDVSSGLSARVAGAAAHGNLVTVLELEGSRSGPSQSISFLDRRTYESLGQFAVYGGMEPDPRPALTTMARAGDTLFVGSETNGLGVASLRALDDALVRPPPLPWKANEPLIANAFRWQPMRPVRALHPHEASEHGPAGVTVVTQGEKTLELAVVDA